MNTTAVAKGIRILEGSALTQRRQVALLIMTLPFLGTLEAVRLLATGTVSATYFALFLAMYFVHMGGVTMGLHRLAAHRSFRTSPLMAGILTAMGSTAGQGPVLFWVSTHRAHHAHSDTEWDPHSPNLHRGGFWGKLHGFWHGHMGWMLSDKSASWAHYARDVMDDRMLMYVHRTYFVWLGLGLVLPTLIGYLIEPSMLGAWKGLIFGGAARMFLANQSAWLVGSLSHLWGGRPFRTRDQSANNWLVAVLAFGEGLQNNHHAFPSCYRHSVRWWEPDLSGWILMALRSVNLVWDTKFPSAETIARARMPVDDRTTSRDKDLER